MNCGFAIKSFLTQNTRLVNGITNRLGNFYYLSAIQVLQFLIISNIFVMVPTLNGLFFKL